MNEAVQAVDTAQVTFAVRDTSIGDKEIHEGNILGMLNDKIEVVAEDIAAGTKELLQKAVTEATSFRSAAGFSATAATASSGALKLILFVCCSRI